MDRVWDMGVTLLEILAGIAMLVSVVVFLGMISEREAQLNAHQATVNAQREYANFQRFHGNGVAYTEVVQAIWELSSTSLPVLVISEDRFRQVTHLNGVGAGAPSSGFPILDPNTTPFNNVPGLSAVPFNVGNNAHMQSINPIILPLVHEHINDWLSLAPDNATLGAHGQGILFNADYLYARGIQSVNPPTPAHQVMQTQVAEWLRDTSHNFNGRVMRGSAGEPYLIIFLY